MSTERNTPRAGSTELTSAARPSPSAIDSGVTIAVKSKVLPVERQKTGSFSSLE